MHNFGIHIELTQYHAECDLYDGTAIRYIVYIGSYNKKLRK